MYDLIGKTVWKLRFKHIPEIYNSARCFSSRPLPRQAGATTTGLYGFDLLKSPQGFQRFVDEAIERSGELVSAISSMSSSAEIIRAMDEISDTVCSVVDSAELCRNTHPDREFVEEANKASMRINEYLHYLNTNHTLYALVKKAEQDGHVLSKEAHRAAHHLRIDFERGGIHLPCENLDRVNELNAGIFQLCREYGENIAIDPGHVDIFPASRIPKCVRHCLTPIDRFTSDSSAGLTVSLNKVKEKGFRIRTEPHILAIVLQWTSDDEVRKMAYIKGNSAPLANLEVLDKLIAARHELSQVIHHTRVVGFLYDEIRHSVYVVAMNVKEMKRRHFLLGFWYLIGVHMFLTV